MMFYRSRFFHLLLAVGLLVIQLPAQSGGPSGPETRNSGSGSESSPNGQAEETSAAAAAHAGLEFSDYPVLSIPGVINVSELSGTGIVLGAGLTGGYGRVDSGVEGNSSGSLSVAEPYIGLYQSGYRHKILLEYSPTIDLFNQNKWNGDVLQRGGLRGFNDLSQHWRFVFSGYATDGTEYLRELGGVGMGEYPGWLTFAHPTQTVLAASGSTGLHWRREPRQELSLTGRGAYSSVRQGSQYEGAAVRAQATSYFARESDWFVYVQADRFSSQPGCTSIGPGIGFNWNIGAGTSLGLGAGPQYWSGRCVERITAAFDGRLVQRLSARTLFFLSASRDMLDPYLLQAAWTDVYSAKVWRKTSRNTTFAAGAGYAISSNVPAELNPRYRGFLLFSEFNWHLSESLKFVGSYKYFKQDFSGQDFGAQGFDNHNSWALLSLVWHPVNRAAKRAQ